MKPVFIVKWICSFLLTPSLSAPTIKKVDVPVPVSFPACSNLKVCVLGSVLFTASLILIVEDFSGIAGASYIPTVQAALPRLLGAAAPPGAGARENRRQCLKVGSLYSCRICQLVDHNLCFIKLKIFLFDKVDGATF